MIRKTVYILFSLLILYGIISGILIWNYCRTIETNTLYNGNDVRQKTIIIDVKKCDYVKQAKLIKVINFIIWPITYVYVNYTKCKWVDDGGINSKIIRDIKNKNYDYYTYVVYDEGGRNFAVLFLNKTSTNKLAIILDYDKSGNLIKESKF